MSSVDLVIVDLDDTLWKWCQTWHAGYLSFNNAVSAVSGADAREAWVHMYGRHEGRVIETPPDPVDLAATLDVSINDAVTYHAFAVSESRKSRDKALELFDGVVDTLTELQQRGIPVIAHTDAPYTAAGQRMYISGIDGLIHSVHAAPLHHVFSEVDDFARTTVVKYDVDWRPKPDPRVLNDIARSHGTHPSNIIYVGDSLRRDMSMARSAGMRPVWARYGNDYSGRDEVIATLAEVHRLRPRHASDYVTVTDTPEFDTVDTFSGILDLI